MENNMTNVINLKHALAVAEDEYSAARAKLEVAQRAYNIEHHRLHGRVPYAQAGLQSTDTDREVKTDC
jgi:hypothetical protein